MQTIYRERMDKQQGPTVKHRNYIQHPVISHNGKEYKRECIDVQLSHCAGQQKLTHKQLHFNFFLKKVGCTILKNNLWR